MNIFYLFYESPNIIYFSLTCEIPFFCKGITVNFQYNTIFTRFLTHYYTNFKQTRVIKNFRHENEEFSKKHVRNFYKNLKSSSSSKIVHTVKDASGMRACESRVPDSINRRSITSSSGISDKSSLLQTGEVLPLLIP